MTVPTHDAPAGVDGLLARIGVQAPFTLTRLPGGRNNRAYHVTTSGQAFFLKAYFRHPEDPRDRLGAEFGFLQFAWANGIRCVPQPLAADAGGALGLYGFVPGTRLTQADVNAVAVDRALEFHAQLNRCRFSPEAQRLPDASEARFSMAGELELVELRVSRLQAVEAEEALAFIHGPFASVWARTREAFETAARQWGLAPDQELGVRERCLSPSDFGFHNALRTPDGALCFVDFEYAGWDDPAKLVADFFCQPALPVPLAFFDRFARAVAGGFDDPKFHRRRMELLLPVFQFKWCCILLNEFLPMPAERRNFGMGDGDMQARRARQLELARAALVRVETLLETLACD